MKLCKNVLVAKLSELRNIKTNELFSKLSERLDASVMEIHVEIGKLFSKSAGDEVAADRISKEILKKYKNSKNAVKAVNDIFG